jgi:hypothetical protein
MDTMNLTLYVKTDNNKYIILNGSRESFRMRQRCRLSDSSRVNPLKFVSYRTMMKQSHKLVGECEFNTRSKL